MKSIVLVTLVLIFMSGCSEKKVVVDNSKSYERANNASEKALSGLERDTK